MPMIIIFPEGATTNGSCMLKFKKGAFASLRPVRPLVFIYKQHFTDKIMLTQDVVGFAKHQLLAGAIGAITVDMDILPVFAPNDYFWENHWQKDKEEKWEAYARVMREIMAAHGGFPESELMLDDKLAYKAELKRIAGGEKHEKQA